MPGNFALPYKLHSIHACDTERTGHTNSYSAVLGQLTGVRHVTYSPDVDMLFPPRGVCLVELGSYF